MIKYSSQYSIRSLNPIVNEVEVNELYNNIIQNIHVCCKKNGYIDTTIY